MKRHALPLAIVLLACAAIGAQDVLRYEDIQHGLPLEPVVRVQQQCPT